MIHKTVLDLVSELVLFLTELGNGVSYLPFWLSQLHGHSMLDCSLL